MPTTTDPQPAPDDPDGPDSPDGPDGIDTFIDAHVHVWDTSVLDYAWLEGQDVLGSRYDLEDLAVAAGSTVELGARLGGVVVVEADRRLDQAEAEIDWVAGLRSPAPLLGVVCAVAIEREDAAERLAAVAIRPEVVGVRRLLQDGDAGLPADDAIVRGARLVGEHGLAFDLCVRQHQLDAVVDLVGRAPETRFVLDHVAKPSLDGPPVATQLAALERLAEHPNLVCKLSGLATEASTGPARRALVVAHLRAALERLGPERCLFASDWPVSATAVGYAAWLGCVLEAADGLSRTERRALLVDTATGAYGLDAPARRQRS